MNIPDAVLRALAFDGYTMRIARRRYRLEARTNAKDKSFREWARSTYSPHGATGKLARIVGAKNQSRKARG